jgi:sugar O-acyltransferase (sialic acid O-acetyltransferase NeuD family)
MKRVLIVGAGGFGREVHTWFEEWRLADPARQGGYLFAGFLDRDPQALAGLAIDAPILGDPATYQPTEADVFICGLGLPKPKMICCRGLQVRGAVFLTIVHPTAIIGPRCTFGVGCVVCPYVVVTCDVQVGDFAVLNLHATIGHDARLGHGVTLSGHADVTGHVTLGDEVFLSSHASVIPGVKVPDRVLVGAGSVVVRADDSDVTMFGVPATPLPTFRRT